MHKAYIEATGANVTKRDGSTVRINFDTPRRKMIASGSEEYCQGQLDAYLAEHEGVKGGVVETSERGDPWHGEWSRVHEMPGF